MSPTKTKPVVDDAAALPADVALKDARAAHDGLLERIGRGETVTPAELVEAEANLRLAVLGADAEAAAAAQSAEDARVGEIDSIIEGLRSGEHALRARVVVDRYAEAVAALGALVTAARDYRQPLEAHARRLRELGPLPEGVRVDWSSYRQIWLDGVNHAFADRLDGDLVADVLVEVLGVHLPSQLRVADMHLRGKPIDRVRVRAGLDG